MVTKQTKTKNINLNLNCKYHNQYITCLWMFKYENTINISQRNTNRCLCMFKYENTINTSQRNTNRW